MSDVERDAVDDRHGERESGQAMRVERVEREDGRLLLLFSWAGRDD